jgi:hypothetical protein
MKIGKLSLPGTSESPCHVQPCCRRSAGFERSSGKIPQGSSNSKGATPADAKALRLNVYSVLCRPNDRTRDERHEPRVAGGKSLRALGPDGSIDSEALGRASPNRLSLQGMEGFLSAGIDIRAH